MIKTTHMYYNTYAPRGGGAICALRSQRIDEYGNVPQRFVVILIIGLI